MNSNDYMEMRKAEWLDFYPDAFFKKHTKNETKQCH